MVMRILDCPVHWVPFVFRFGSRKPRLLSRLPLRGMTQPLLRTEQWVDPLSFSEGGNRLPLICALRYTEKNRAEKGHKNKDGFTLWVPNPENPYRESSLPAW